MPTSREVDNLRSETLAAANSRFAAVTEEEMLQLLTFFEYVVLSSSLYMLIRLFSSMSVNSGF